MNAREVPGTENAAHPFWSPDGGSLAFMAEGKLKKVAATGGPVQVLSDRAIRFGGSWGTGGLIVFEGDATELRHSEDPYLKTFLS